MVVVGVSSIDHELYPRVSSESRMLCLFPECLCQSYQEGRKTYAIVCAGDFIEGLSYVFLLNASVIVGHVFVCCAIMFCKTLCTLRLVYSTGFVRCG